MFQTSDIRTDMGYVSEQMKRFQGSIDKINKKHREMLEKDLYSSLNDEMAEKLEENLKIQSKEISETIGKQSKESLAKVRQ